jgi:hypothetical protein
MSFKYLSVIPVFFTCALSYAQVKKPVAVTTPPAISQKAGLVAVASVVKNGISIRWAPNNEAAWKEVNKVGYVVERYTVMRDNKILDRVERKILKRLLKPLPLKYWDSTLLNKNDYAAVVAQALYGEGFEMIMKDKQSVQSLVSLSNEKKQRYAMAMYAADHSFPVALMAGLGLRDTAVKKNEKYLYRIFSPVSPSVLKIDTAKVFIGLADDKPLPKPAEILPKPGDKVAMLAWEYDNLTDFYGSYDVERSDDGGATFHKTSEKPVTKLVSSTEGASNTSIVYTDTLTNNTTVFKYRVAGVTLFDEVGPYSEVVSVKGIPTIETAPHITGAENVADGKGTLKWQVEDSVVSLIKNFEISSASLAEGPYKVIVPNIDVTKRSVELKDISSDAAYITVTAVVKEGENKVSMPYLLQAEDSLPPVIPAGLRGVIDTTGIVRLDWNANMEKDLMGYKVFKTYVKGQEVTGIMDTVWKSNSFTDTVNIKNLNSKIYYAVVAIDKRYNQSGFSLLLEIKKPDVIPPSQPVFKDYAVADTVLTLTWVNSYDEDLKYTKLLRKGLSDSLAKWDTIKQFNRGSSVTEYKDISAKSGNAYAYTLISVDSSGLESDPAIPLTVALPDAFDKSAIRKFDAAADRDARNITLTWSLSAGQKISQIEIYKATEKEKLSLYKVLGNDAADFVDTELKVNSKYQYGVRVIFFDGKNSEIKIKKVNY